MVIKPKVRGFICTTAHPLGCEANVLSEINTARKLGEPNNIPKRVLVIGSSMGYGLSSRIVSAFGGNSSTLGVCFEREPEENRTASPGWYNTATFHKFAQAEGLYARTVNGDAFSNTTKAHIIDAIRKDLGKVDLVVYSIAAPKRTDPITEEVYSSVLKPIGELYTGKTVNPNTGEVREVSVPPATEEETNNTVKVMGGEDWLLWAKELLDADVLEQNVLMLAYSYLGPEITKPIYRRGTIGKAKEHLEKSALDINNLLKDLKGQALISINKALVTQASSAIPVLPLYIALLFRVMKSKGTHEGCIEQIHRLFHKKLYQGNAKKHLVEPKTGFVRLDDLEMEADVQQQIKSLWPKINADNVFELSDLEGYREEFLRLFGFGNKNIDYEADVNPEAKPTLFEAIAP